MTPPLTICSHCEEPLFPDEPTLRVLYRLEWHPVHRRCLGYTAYHLLHDASEPVTYVEVMA